MENNNEKKAFVLGKPTGCVGQGPFSVWVHNEAGDTAPEAFGFASAGDAFRHIEKRKVADQKKIAAVRALADSTLGVVCALSEDGTERELKESDIAELFSNIELPSYKVFKMEEIKPTDTSVLPSLEGLNIDRAA